MRAGLYVRVSSDEQTTDNQKPELEQLARARGWEIVFYEEIESAAKRRPVLEKLLDDARCGRVQVVACWALDRLGRSAFDTARRIKELDAADVRVVSIREPWMDTGGPVRDLLIYVFGWVAEQERNRLIERTKAGLERAKREGKRLGRPAKASPILLHAAADLVKKGMGLRAAARAKGVPTSSLRRIVERARSRRSASLS